MQHRDAVRPPPWPVGREARGTLPPAEGGPPSERGAAPGDGLATLVERVSAPPVAERTTEIDTLEEHASHSCSPEAPTLAPDEWVEPATDGEAITLSPPPAEPGLISGIRPVAPVDSGPVFSDEESPTRPDPTLVSRLPPVALSS